MKLMHLYSDRKGSELVALTGARLRRDLKKRCGETVWNMELLRSPKLRMLAAREAAEADVIIIALEEDKKLSPELKQWLQLWKNRKRRKRSVLVALLSREQSRTPRSIGRALHSFARAARMDFFCHSRVEPTWVRYSEGLEYALVI